jgi:alkylation response protein AidB-like acyl-CoA dehydrogenase
MADEHRLLRESLRDTLRAAMPAATLERCYEAEPLPREPWRAVAEGGWLELLDGDELTTLDVTLLAEEVGASLLPGPFAATVAFVVPLLRATGREEDAGAVSSGERMIATVAPRPAWPRKLAWEPRIRCTMSADGGGVLHGTARNVDYLEQSAATLVIVGCDDRSTRAALIGADQARASIVSAEANDATRPTATLTLEGLVVEPGDWLHEPGADLTGLVGRLMARYVSLLNGESLGGMQEIVARTITYVSERRQFDVPVGSFQAVKHLIADAESAREVARVFALQTAASLEEDPSGNIDLLCSRLLVAQAYTRVCETAIQCFGGFGFSWEYAIHFWYRRALLDQTLPISLRDLRHLIATAVPEEHTA